MATEFDKLVDEIIVNEGWFDRAKAKGAGLVGAAKGLKDRVTSTFQGAASGIKGNTAGVVAAKSKNTAAKQMGTGAKSRSIVFNHVKKLQKEIDDFGDDLVKLGLVSDADGQKFKTLAWSRIKGALPKAFQNKVSAGVKVP